MSAVDSKLAGNGLGSRIFYRFGRFVVTGFIRIMARPSIEGRENVPKRGAFVLAPIHRSYVDTPLAACVTKRRLRFMGKDTLWKHPFPGWVLSALGGFPVSRGTADREALERSIAVLEGGEPAVLFPEGERKSGPIVQPLFDGAVYIALKAKVPIVPVGIGGSERVMPKGVRWIRPAKVYMIIGKPIEPPASDSKRVPRALVKQASAQLHTELQRLFDAAQARAGLPRVDAPAPDDQPGDQPEK